MIELMQGDCLERMKEIPDGSVDMVLTDPPYGATACKWDSIIPLEPMWQQLKRVIKPNGAIVMTASQPFTTTLIGSNMKMFKYCWHWHKGYSTGFANCNKMPMKAFEDVVVFYSKLPTYNPQGLTRCGIVNKRGGQSEAMGRTGCVGGEYVQRFTNYPTDEIRTKKEKTQHPTGKPVALMEYMIKTYTNEGETVLDFTMGSGTTGVAAKNLGRKFIGIELDPAYFKIAQERIESV
jgi:site-specific DNA-methyltransferase (adenine-specific)